MRRETGSLPRPPVLFRWALYLFLGAADRRVVTSELAELYEARSVRDGDRAARAWYLRQVRQYPWRLLAERLLRPRLPERTQSSHAPPPPRRPGETMSTLFEELRLSARSLIKKPGLTVTVVLTLGLGIGAAATVFSAVHAVLLAPLPYDQPERLMRIYSDHPPDRWPLSVVDYDAIVEQQRHFERIAAYQNTAMTFTGAGTADRVIGKRVTPGYFGLLGVTPMTGRTFAPEDGVPGAPLAAVVSHRFWRQHLGADDDAVGRPITLDGDTYTLVGVLPSQAGPLEEGREVFTALQLEPPQRKGPFFLTVLARLAPDAPVAEAREELRAINRRIFPLWQDSYPDATVSYGVETVRDFVIGEVGTPLLVLFGAVGFVLLIASTNAANLLVARGMRRARELAVRSALGARKGRLLRHLLIESALLASGGGVLGLAVTAASVRILQAAGAGALPRAAELGLSGPVLWFAVAVTGGALLVFGLIPSLQVVGSDFERALRTGGRSATATGAGQRVRRVLVVSQFAVAVPLLVAAGLLMTSFLKLQGVDTGFPTDRLLTVGLPLPDTAYPDEAAVRSFWNGVTERVAALPGVTGAGMGTGRPPAEYPFENNFNLLDRPTPPDEAEPVTPWMVVDDRYFEAVGIPLVDGRRFDARDRPDGVSAVIVDQTWARRFFPGEEVVGRRLTAGGCNGPECPRLTVVGVVGDVKYTGLGDAGRGMVYLPLNQEPAWSGFLFVRTATDPLAVVSAVREIVHDLDPALPLTRIATMEELLRDDLATPRSFLSLIGSFALVALLLAALGIYGVMSYFVQQHEREIGLRMAIGGGRDTVERLVVGRGLRLAALGLALGLSGAFALTRFLASLLFDVRPTDPFTFAGVLAVLGLTAILACYLPARRASRVDPVVALRAEA